MKKTIQKNKNASLIFILIIVLILPLNFAFPFAYIFAGEANGVNTIVHPAGYSGIGGILTVSVGIDPTSANAIDMEIPVQNVVNAYNNLTATTGNIINGPLPSGNIDFESVLLHEMGHSLGLAHCNLATESGLTGNDQNFTKSTDGADNSFTVAGGFDIVIGSADDFRGDDVNLNYFKIADNNPFTIASTVDQTTYSRDLADLPIGDDYSANADRDVADLLGVPNTEGVMQQGTFGNERQRSLSADDVAGIRYAAAGIDEIEGTSDDYTLVLNYVGLNAGADIVIDFDNTETSFAVSQSSGLFLGPNHISITVPSNIYFNTNSNWYFNTTLSVDEQNAIANITLYPNPTEGSIIINNSQLVDIKSVNVYDIKGRSIFNKELNSGVVSNQITVDISNLESGIYIFVVTSETGSLVKRIVKN